MNTAMQVAAIVVVATLAGCAGQRPLDVDTTGDEADGLAGIDGIVVTSELTPIVGALVAVGPQQATSDASGQVRIRGLPAGTHPVQVVALGYESYQASVDLGEGEIRSLTITLIDI